MSSRAIPTATARGLGRRFRMASRMGRGAWGWDYPYVYQEGVIGVDIYDGSPSRPCGTPRWTRIS